MAGSVLLADVPRSTALVQALTACALLVPVGLLALRVRWLRRTRRRTIPLEGLLGPVPVSAGTVVTPGGAPGRGPEGTLPGRGTSPGTERAPHGTGTGQERTRGSPGPRRVSDLLRTGTVWPDSGPFVAGPGGPGTRVAGCVARAGEEQRRVLVRTRRELAGVRDRTRIAEITACGAREAVGAGYAALVVRSVEGPRVLWQEPGGTGALQIWGPATLGALLSLSEPLCEVVGSDPLAADGPTSVLAVPVPAGGVNVGTVVARRRPERPFLPADRDALTRLARMAGAALDRQARRGDVHGRDDVDAVTDLPRYGRLLQDLRRALSGAERHGMPLTLVAVHLADLRLLRAERGGIEADRVLNGVVRQLFSALRVGDVTYRLGEDELAVLLVGTDPRETGTVADRIRAAVAVRSGGGTRIVVRPVTGVAEDVLSSATGALPAPDGRGTRPR